jgi:hypothetical protein
MRYLLTTCVLAGCDAAQPPETAQQLFTNRAWPALARCAGCHAAQPTIDFLAPGTAAGAYETMFAFQPPIVDVASPASSLVLTMGKHTGPAMLPTESDAVLAWLEAEHTERVPMGAMPVSFGPVPLALGAVNTVDLGGGASLRFVPSPAAEGMALRSIVVTAGTTALHVVHPLLASQPALGPPRIDTNDVFGDVDLDLTAGATVALGGGSAVFAAFDPDDPIIFYFRTLEAP